MTSNPLFIMVAESTEILRPMTQFGCAQASSGVTRCSSARERALKGPPDPVRRILRIPFATDSPAAKGGRHWKIALCSLSMGSSIAPLERTLSMNTGPATTRASLFASSSFFPALAAASVARSPAAPTIAAMTQSTSGKEATSTSPASPQVSCKSNRLQRGARAAAVRARHPPRMRSRAGVACIAPPARRLADWRSMQPPGSATDAARSRPEYSPRSSPSLRVSRCFESWSSHERKYCQGEHGHRRIDAVEYASVAGQKRAAVLDSRLAFYQRFEQIANYPSHGEPEQNREDPRGPPFHGAAAQGCPSGSVETDCSQRPCDTLPGLPGTDGRGELVFTEAPADKIRSRVGDPHRREDGEEEGRMNAAQVHKRGGGRQEHRGAGCQQHDPAVNARLPPNPHRDKDDPEQPPSIVNPGRRIQAVRHGRLEDPGEHKKSNQEYRVDRARDCAKRHQCSPFPGGKSEKHAAKCDPGVLGQ